MWKIFANVKDGVWKARSPATSVSVFYYPLSQMPPQLLKAAVLYFERVRLLVPGKWKITNDRRDNNLRKFLKNTKPLQEEGLLQLVQLREIRVGKAKMKTLADGSLDFTHFPTQFNFTQLALEGVLALANAFPSDEMATKLVSEELDYLARFMEQGEVPITDQRGAQSAFLDSYNNLLTRPELREVRSAFEKDFHVTLMLRTVLETLLPSYDVRSYDDLLELRWRLGDEVGQYRDALAQFLNKLQLQPFEEGADDIRNDVRALDVAIASSKRKQGLPSTGSSGSLSRKAWLVQWRSLPLWPQEHHCPCFSCFRRRRTLRTNMAI